VKRSSIQPNDKFGRLTVIKRVLNSDYPQLNTKRTLYQCLCSCGKIKIIDAGNLKKNVKSCGCLKRELAIQKGKSQKTKESHLNSFYGDCRRRAKNRNIEFTLSKDYYFKLIQEDCYYCGKPPTIKNWKSNIGVPTATNGVDRIDSSKGYLEDNTVACCPVCNTTKLDRSQTQCLLLQCHLKSDLIPLK